MTADTYFGSNGYSLRLKGLEPGFNDMALARAIVLHGAYYVSQEAIKVLGRLSTVLAYRDFGVTHSVYRENWSRY